MSSLDLLVSAPMAEQEVGGVKSDSDSAEPERRNRASTRASRACQACRKRKARCDNKKPKCGQCVRSSSECVVDQPDGRKLHTKHRIADLQSRLDSLERVTASANAGARISAEINAPPPTTAFPLPSSSLASITIPVSNSPNQSSSSAQIHFATPELPSIAATEPTSSGWTDPVVPVVRPPTSPGESPSSRSSRTADGSSMSFALFQPPEGEESLQNALLTTRKDMAALGPGLETPNVETSVKNSLAAQISGRNGRLSFTDGHLRWYGATSNRHLAFGRLAPSSRPANLNTRCIETLARFNMDSLNLEPKLEQRLLNLYFVWQDRFFHLIDQKVYEAERRRFLEGSPECQFYSPALHWSILAYAAHLSDEAVSLAGTAPERAGDEFMARARMCLDQEMDSPRETTVQALAIMAAREAGCGNDARGWIYISMSAGSAIDLGLHTDATPLRESGAITLEEFSVRNMVWWGSFCYERLWSLYVGRPSIFVTKTIQTPPPPQDTICGSLVRLLQITDVITTTLYSGSPFQSTTVALSSWVDDIHQRLLDWQESLPLQQTLDLELQPSPPAEVILLHIQYFATLILLHRPLVCDASKTVLADTQSFKVCCSSAEQAANLLDLYRRLFTFRRISVVAPHQVFTAATFLVFVLHVEDSVVGAASTSQVRPNMPTGIRRSLLLCLGALSALAATQVHARRSYLQVIMLMKRWSVSVDVLPPHHETLSHTTVHTPDEAEQFESLSRELFELSRRQNYAEQPLGHATATMLEDSTAFASAQMPLATESTDAATEDDFFWQQFFGTMPAATAEPELPVAEAWTGPSLFDMFTVSGGQESDWATTTF
ncbi:hypothetical protein T439DRAFT_348051 [Meredithblackwellia eburnea MCA 4105]